VERAFGEQLREHRQAAGISQGALGDLVGVDQSYVNRLESGKRPPPDRDLVVDLARALALDELSRQRLLRSAGHVPDWLLTLPADDPTVLAVARFLAAPDISDAAKREFRQAIALMLGRWRTS
jgi:transcriptional regulator with XRE-family HTH domain